MAHILPDQVLTIADQYPGLDLERDSLLREILDELRALRKDLRTILKVDPVCPICGESPFDPELHAQWHAERGESP